MFKELVTPAGGTFGDGDAARQYFPTDGGVWIHVAFTATNPEGAMAL